MIASALYALTIVIASLTGDNIEVEKRDRQFTMKTDCLMAGSYYAGHLADAARNAGFPVRVTYKCKSTGK